MNSPVRLNGMGVVYAVQTAFSNQPQVLGSLLSDKWSRLLPPQAYGVLIAL